MTLESQTPAPPSGSGGTLRPDAVLRRRPSPEVEWVVVDGEIVAWNEPRETLHLLDPPAALVYQLLDGQSSLAEIVIDLAEVFQRDPAEVEGDVVRLASLLESSALVEHAS